MSERINEKKEKRTKGGKKKKERSNNTIPKGKSGKSKEYRTVEYWNEIVR